MTGAIAILVIITVSICLITTGVSLRHHLRHLKDEAEANRMNRMREHERQIEAEANRMWEHERQIEAEANRMWEHERQQIKDEKWKQQENVS